MAVEVITPDFREKGQQRPIRLMLVEKDDHVTLKAYDPDMPGCPWNVMRFEEDGTFSRIGSIGENSGLSLDLDGRIVERE